jgi:hypothetical protein
MGMPAESDPHDGPWEQFIPVLAEALTRGTQEVLELVLPWAADLPQGALPELAAELGTAMARRTSSRVAAGAEADQVPAIIAGWKATAEAYADPELLAALRAPGSDCGPVPEPAVA